MKKLLALVVAFVFVLSFAAFAQVAPEKGPITVEKPSKELEKPVVEQVPATKPQTAKMLKVKQTKEANDLRLKQAKEANDLKCKQDKEAADLKAKQVKEAKELKAQQVKDAAELKAKK